MDLKHKTGVWPHKHNINDENIFNPFKYFILEQKNNKNK